MINDEKKQTEDVQAAIYVDNSGKFTIVGADAAWTSVEPPYRCPKHGPRWGDLVIARAGGGEDVFCGPCLADALKGLGMVPMENTKGGWDH